MTFDRIPALPELEDREIEIPAGGLHLLEAGGGIKAVGELFHTDALLRATGGPRRNGVHMQLTAAIVPEPENPHDSNAIAVRIAGETVAYLPREIAPAYRPVFDRLRDLRIVGYCSVLVRGGWDLGGGSRAAFRVIVYIDCPRGQMVAIERALVKAASLADPRAACANTGCPYCSAPLARLPKRRSACPSCSQPVFVHEAPDGLLYLLQEQDLHVVEEAWGEVFEERRRFFEG